MPKNALRRKVHPTEYDEDIVFVEWLELKHLRFSHIPQETYTKHWGVKMRNKRMGVRKGVPDFIIVLPLCLVFIEMKRVGMSPSSLKPEQKDWINALKAVSNVYAYTAFGADQAIQLVTQHLWPK